MREPDKVNDPPFCEWAPFRAAGAPSCPIPGYPYALACPWCPALEDSDYPSPEGG